MKCRLSGHISWLPACFPKLVFDSNWLKRSFLLESKKLWPEETEQKDSLPEHIGHEKIAFSDDEPADVEVVVHGFSELILRIGGIAGKVIASDWVSSIISAYSSSDTTIGLFSSPESLIPAKLSASARLVKHVYHGSFPRGRFLPFLYASNWAMVVKTLPS